MDGHGHVDLLADQVDLTGIGLIHRFALDRQIFTFEYPFIELEVSCQDLVRHSFQVHVRQLQSENLGHVQQGEDLAQKRKLVKHAIPDLND